MLFLVILNHSIQERPQWRETASHNHLNHPVLGLFIDMRP